VEFGAHRVVGVVSDRIPHRLNPAQQFGFSVHTGEALQNRHHARLGGGAGGL